MAAAVYAVFCVGGGLRSCDRQILPHFVHFLGADAADGGEVVDTFEGAVGFAHLEDFVGGNRTDPRHLLQLRGTGGVDVDGLRGWLLFSRGRGKSEKE